MGKECPSELGGKTYRSFGGKILGGDGADKTDDTKTYQQKAHPCDIRFVSVCNADVNDGGNDQRHEQFKGRLQKLEKRTENSLFFILAQVD